MPTQIKGGYYVDVEEFRKICGYTSTQPIYRALREGRIPGAEKVGKIYIIPNNALIVNRSIKHGGYIGVAKQVKEAKERHEHNMSNNINKKY